MQTQKTHLPSVLTLVLFGISVLFLILIVAGIFLSSIIDLFSNNGDAAGQMISAVAFGFELILLLVCARFVYQKSRGDQQADLPFHFPFVEWQFFVIPAMIFGALMIGAVIALTEIRWLTWIFLPVLTLFVIVPPIWLLFGIGSKGIDLGPRWRFFSVFGIGLTIGPVIMIVLEMVILLGAIITAVVVLAVREPVLMQEIADLGQMLQNETNPDVVLEMVAPYAGKPIVIASVLGYIALIVPLIEELFKPLAVWLFAMKIETPAQGFALGMLSGSAFALLESLNASGDGSVSWPVIVAIRAATGLLHMTTSGLVGWGIVSAFREKKILRAVSAYLCAVTLHGLWNACAVGAGISTIGTFIGKPEWMFNILPAVLCGMSVMILGMFAVLLASNRKLRIAAQPAAAPAQLLENEPGVESSNE